MVELGMLVTAMLLIVSIIATRASHRLGVPALILFLAIGMVAGSDGPGRIFFNDYGLAQAVGVVALAFILFSGGLDTDWPTIRPILSQGLALANIGVIISAGLVGAFASWAMGLTLLEGLLLGAIVSSTDAAAVFSVMRMQGVNLKHRLEPLIELESGSNDPIAVFLTVGLTGILGAGGGSLLTLVPSFLLQMALGTAGGYLFGRLMVWSINHIRLQQEGLYVVFTVGLMLLTYSATYLLGGNGFLAVYLAGIVVGNANLVHKRSVLRFHDGMAWLMQIGMFLCLGLLVYPSQLLLVAGWGVLMALFLVLVARPLSVVAALVWFRRSPRELAMVSWAGLRGAVPIVLATYPLLAGLPRAQTIFDLVFFIVVVSVLLQGISIAWVARLLGVNDLRPHAPDARTFTPEVRLSSRIIEAVVPPGSPLVGRSLIELGMPQGVLLVQIQRGGAQIIPDGATILRADDHLLMLTTPEALPSLAALRDQAAVHLVTPTGSGDRATVR
ncbi:MAG: potassium/proton antiporter [Chloroflexales bacterium]|nr:potassium/proton antiporter [Chloroflexales bacterium]